MRPLQKSGHIPWGTCGFAGADSSVIVTVCVGVSPCPVCPWECGGQSPAWPSPARRRVALSPSQEQRFCQRYDQLMEAWEKKVERIENNPRRRAKESKVREYYEKQFPEIRKQRELQERMQR